MVLKKPYAFLIKNFKKVHLVLSILLLYLAFTTSNLLGFYNNFIKNLVSATDASKHINTYMYLAIILVIVGSIIIYLLMKQKDKPKTLYIIMIISYFAILIVFFLTSNNLNILETEMIEQKTIRLYRDIIRIILVFEYISIIPMIIRTMGFDIKKFEFAKDLNEMNIEVTDDEEFELLVGVDTDKIKRKGRRRLRELYYYYQENKIFILIILFFLIAIMGVYLFVNIKIFNKTYTENEPFSSYNYLLSVEKSYFTTKNYQGENVGINDTGYVIIKLNVASNIEGEYSLNTNDFILVANNETFLPTKKYYDYFKDLGIGYKKQNITKDATKTYLLVYNIDKKYLSKKMILRYELNYDDKGVSNRIIELNPTNLDKTNLVNKYNLNEELKFSDSILSNSTLLINKYELKNNFTYIYSKCVKDNDCYDKTVVINGEDNKTILNLNLSSTFDKLSIDIDNNALFDYYAKIKYISDGTEYKSDFVNVTPETYKDGLFLEVDENMILAAKIWIEFNIRDKEYIYNIK